MKTNTKMNEGHPQYEKDPEKGDNLAHTTHTPLFNPASEASYK